VSNFTALFDACVLYPAPLRDFLMRLAITDLFRAKWTDEIHDEWIRNVLKNRPDLTEERLHRTLLHTICQIFRLQLLSNMVSRLSIPMSLLFI